MTVFLEDGTPFEDWTGQASANSLGLGRKDMAKALSDQSQRLSWLSPGLLADVRLALTRDLQSILPHGIAIPFYGIGGSDSIEAAIRAARRVTRRKKVLSFADGYHGDTITTESVSGWTVEDSGNPLPWTVHVPSPHDWFQESGAWDGAYERCLAGIERAIAKHGSRTFACFIVEPVADSAGAVPLSSDFSKALRELCDRHGIKLVADEVITGFGRTGEWFGSTTVGLNPDAVVLAKAMTGGYAPLGAAVFERSWGEELLGKGFPHGLTFGGHPLGCVAARETIRILKEERLVERAKAVGAYMKRRLEAIQGMGVVLDVRGAGLMLGVELRGPGNTARTTNEERLVERAKAVGAYMKRRLEAESIGVMGEIRAVGVTLGRRLRTPGSGKRYKTHPAWPRVAAVQEGLRREGVLIWRSGDGASLLFCPPLIVTEAQVDRLVERLDVHLRRIAGQGTASSTE